VLLFHGIDPADPTDDYWVTPGGGLEPGESAVQGAVRELFEETGLRVDPETLGEPVFRNVVEFSFDGRRYRQEQDFFLLRVPSWEVDTANFDEVVRKALAGAAIRIPPGEVDSRGLHVCNVAAMRRALASLAVRPSYVLTDGFPVDGLATPGLAVWKGDQVAACVAAASVIAKVTRDR